jgi:cyclophilin family peptidyl-prolyl cis-trans isomerase
VAKGGYQKRRIAQKKAAERAQRKRAARRKTMLTSVVVIAVLAMIGGIVLAVVLGGNEGSLANPDASPSPTPSAPLPEGCAAATPANEAPRTYKSPPSMVIDRSKTYTATLETSCGTIEVELLDNAASKTVNNFVFLAREGFYDGSIFHRVIDGFGEGSTAMVQGGDPVNDTGTGGPGYEFDDENTIPFTEPGYLAMANSGPGTNGSQFFFLEGTVAHLNAPGSCPGPQGCHSVFGKVTEGLDAIDRIGGVPKDPADPSNSKPLIDVVLISVTIDES